jgi:hypothetical protein
MEPVASGIAIFQLIQTIAQASAFVYGYIAAVRNANSSYHSLLDELNSIIRVLTMVREIEKETPLPKNLRHTLSQLTAKNGPVVKLQVELKNLLPDEPEKKNLKIRPKLMWPFKEQKTEVITARLKALYIDITTALAKDSW